MQTFLLGQAVLEHAALSSISTTVGSARYQLGVFVESLDTTKLLIGIGFVVLVMVLWRR